MSSIIKLWGKGLGIQVPRAVAKRVNLKEGMEVDLEVSRGAIVVRPHGTGRRRIKLSELLAQFPAGGSPHRELWNDPPRGKELI